MKKVIFAAMAIAVAASAACTRVLQPTVDFGATTYVNDYSALTAAVKDMSKSVSDKLALIQEAIDNGTASEKEALGLIQTAITSLEAEVKAGNISEAEALEAIKEAIAAQTTSFELKLTAIETALTTGFTAEAEAIALVKDAVASLEAEVKAGNISEAEALEAIKDAIAAQTTSFELKLTAIETALTTGFTAEAEAIALLKDAVASLEAEVKAGNVSEDEALAKIYDALSSIKDGEDAIKDGEDAINETLTAILNDKGVYPDPNKQYIGLSPELWAMVSANTSSEMYQSILRDLPKIDQAARVYQINPAGEQTGHTCLTSTLADQASLELSATKAQLGDKIIYKVYRMRSWMKYNITVASDCDWPWISKIQIIDAMGNNTKTVSTSHTAYGVTVYYINDGSIINNAIINVHCIR